MGNERNPLRGMKIRFWGLTAILLCVGITKAVPPRKATPSRPPPSRWKPPRATPVPSSQRPDQITKHPKRTKASKRHKKHFRRRRYDAVGAWRTARKTPTGRRRPYYGLSAGYRSRRFHHGGYWSGYYGLSYPWSFYRYGYPVREKQYYYIYPPGQGTTVPGTKRSDPANVTQDRITAAQRLSESWMEKGLKAFEKGKYRRAEWAFLRAASVIPDDPAPHFARSQAFFAAGDYHFAAAALREAFARLHPDYPVFMYPASFYPDKAVLDQQIAALREKAIGSHHSDLLFLLGYHLMFTGRRAEAASILRDALQKAPPWEKAEIQLLLEQ